MNEPQITPMSTTLPATPCIDVNQLLATIAELRAQLAERANLGIEQLRTDLAKEVHALDCRVENEMAQHEQRIEAIVQWRREHDGYHLGDEGCASKQDVLDAEGRIYKRIVECIAERSACPPAAKEPKPTNDLFGPEDCCTCHACELYRSALPYCQHYEEGYCRLKWERNTKKRQPKEAEKPRHSDTALDALVDLVRKAHSPQSQEPQSVEPHTLVASKADIDALAAKLDALPDMQEIERNFIAAFKLLMAKIDALAEAVKKQPPAGEMKA